MLSFKIKAVIYHHYTKKGEFHICIYNSKKKIISYLQIKITINCKLTQMIYLYVISTN